MDREVRARFWIEIGVIVHGRRLRLGMSQGFVARVVGMPRSALVLVEAGRRGLDLFEALALVAVLRITLDDLLTSGGA